MRVVLAALFAGVLCVRSPAQDATDPREELYQRWIADLARDDLAAREEASHRLAKAGRAAWPALERAAHHSNPEIRARTTQILAASRLRRQIPHRLLLEQPGALEAFDAAGTADKIRLIRAMGRYDEECRPFLLQFLSDSDPEVVIAAADALYENRHYEWVSPLLRLLAAESPPRSARVQELLATASAMIPAGALSGWIEQAGPRGRSRLVELATNAPVQIALPDPLLEAMLQDPLVLSQRAALGWMRERLKPGCYPGAERLLSSPHAGVVADALVTLRRLHHPTDPGLLRSLVRHEEDTVREEALESLVAAAAPEAAAVARTLLNDQSTSVRRAALAALWKIAGSEALDDTLRVYLEDAGEQRELAASYLVRSQDWSTPRLREAFAHSDPDRRLRAADLLARLEGTAICFEAAKDPAETVRLWALRRILSLDTPSSHETLETFSRDPGEIIRFEALRSLVRRGRTEHLPALATFLSNPEYTYRMEAAETLFEHGGEEMTEIARRHLEDPDPYLRRLALGALSDRNHFGETGRALDMLDTPEPRLRRAAANYISQAMANRKDPGVVQTLAGKLEGLDDDSFSLSFQVVTRYGDATSRPVVRRILITGRAGSHDRVLRSLADWSGNQASDELVSLLGDNASLNDSVFQQIPGRGAAGPPLINRVRELLSHPRAAVRAGAVRAVGRLQLNDLTRDLSRLLSDEAPEVRHAAVGSCVELSLYSDLLQAALDDEDPDVRERAAGALSRLRPGLRPVVQRAAENEDCAWVKRRIETLLAEWK